MHPIPSVPATLFRCQGSRARMGGLRWLAAAVLLGALAACSPPLDWRAVRMEGAGLEALLPCKPDRAARPVELGGRTVELSMAGCRADGATFAVSHMVLDGSADATDAGAVLAQWRTATLGRMGVSAADAAAVSSPFTLPGALPLPQAVRLQVQGVSPDDAAAVVAQAVWFARAEAAAAGAAPRLRLYHSVIYAPTPRTAAADTFFGGLALR